jgi:hypothetical protein
VTALRRIVVTVTDSRREKDAEFWARPAVARAVAQSERDRENAEFVAMHPHVGVLCRRGRPVYYVNFPRYVESADPRSLVQEDA